MRVQEPARSPDSEAAPVTILLVDDEEHVRLVTRRLLEAKGFRVDTACGGREGVDAYRADPARYDLVLVDRNMPDLDGLDAMREMRRVNMTVPMVLLSGQPEALEADGEAVPTGFLMKPYGLDDLHAAVVAALAA